ncbi:class I SAM-dependent methyltransferase [Erythrobacter sp. BLCC-B19]|uniref:class I SAM-dependent methyltransferase n=1 Tax=Erythrobacter sp. BLCC-B19 TaxID=3025315 RepID=UPI00235F45B9|nr:methyltransferase domain-containing protein [Erythrobacter sp. BLCC-B19]WDA40678.1 methyltransferase domain-containing protein [Erythrobacter sp. BLCC-B19]
MTQSAPEALKGEDWAGEMGERWLASLDRFEGMIAPIGAALLARADYAKGERVLDLGCGGGATTLAIAEAVGPNGAALGLDIAPMLIAQAKARAAAAASPARFVCADAATAALDEPPFDRLFSRFGSMFFEAPVPAFTNLRGWLKPGARIDLAVWAHPRDNAWMMEMMGVVRSHVDVPPAVPRAPGPFAFEDLSYLEAILTEAGFGAMEAVAYEGEQPVGGPNATPQEATAFALASMAAGRILAEQGEAVLAAARADLTAMFTRFHREGEGVMLGCKAWLVSAQA